MVEESYVRTSAGQRFAWCIKIQGEIMIDEQAIKKVKSDSRGKHRCNECGAVTANQFNK